MEYVDERIGEKSIGYRFWGVKEEINSLIQKIEVLGEPVFQQKQNIQFFEKKEINRTPIEKNQEADALDLQVMKWEDIPIEILSESKEAIDSMLVSGQIDTSFSLGVVEEDILVAVLFVGRDLQSNVFVYQPICLSDGNQMKLYHLLYSYLKKMLLVDENLGENITFFLSQDDEKEAVKSIFGKCKSRAVALDLMVDSKMSDELLKVVQDFKNADVEENVLLIRPSMEVFGRGYLEFELLNGEIL